VSSGGEPAQRSEEHTVHTSGSLPPSTLEGPRVAPMKRVRSRCDHAAMHADLSMSCVECDIPAGLTMVEWRRARHATERPRRRGLRRFRRRGA
jgi:hypothetical protein